MRLNGKVAIVTGGAQGFGRGIAERFAAEGARVMIADLKAEAAEALARTLPAARACPCDVSRDSDWARLVAATLEAFGGLDIVVNNAGTSHRNRPMLEVDEAEFDRIYAVNVKSIYLSAKHCVPVFRAQGRGGVFVQIASTAGVRPRPGLTWYNGTKGAVIVTSRSMAVELAPERIRVNCINPVMGETGLLETFMGGEDTPERRAKFIATIPLGRLSTPRDVANAALFLASDEAEFITGACLEVDGGRCV
ncbi:MAG: glucose 1-dehydrogenase [Casimicrobiaceae bacterium]|nr:glucose 1-dehydrogenase [Casimicrobiaceae bacterium]MCX8098476.1 glucose 1-dehydrogenase [Casimicrobiaceae bacterium]MDW8311580.1 glucose 1-dehydrogenase [Burkholderiales bacterium]